MSIFKPYTVLGKFFNTKVGKVAGTVVGTVMTIEAGIALGALGASTVKAVKDGKILNSDVISTLKKEGIEVTKENINKAKQAIADEAAKQGVKVEVQPTNYAGPGAGFFSFITENIVFVVGGIIVFIIVFIFKPFGGSKIVGRRK